MNAARIDYLYRRGLLTVDEMQEAHRKNRNDNAIRDFQASVHALDLIPTGTPFAPHLI